MLSQAELEEAWAEMEVILSQVVQPWKQKRQDYRDAFMDLGSKGQYSEIHRKVKKLKRAVWDGFDLFGESPEQVAEEIIPHCVMMIYLLRRGL
jgi:hypothetical protein